MNFKKILEFIVWYAELWFKLFVTVSILSFWMLAVVYMANEGEVPGNQLTIFQVIPSVWGLGVIFGLLCQMILILMNKWGTKNESKT